MKSFKASQLLHVLSKIRIPLILIIVIEIIKRIPALCNFYNSHIYPYISYFFYSISQFFRFSFYDICLFSVIVFLIIQIIFLFRKKSRKRSFYIIIKTFMWTYIAFYFCWGINYFSDGVVKKNKLEAKIENDDFRKFINQYILNLNESFKNSDSITENEVIEEISYLIPLTSDQLNIKTWITDFKTKYSLFSRLYAAMGIKGYYAPFFFESHINNQAMNIEKPALMAHELSHLLGITSEAEANFMAYIITTSSKNDFIRFSGYFSVFPYIMRDARNHLPEEEYNNLFGQVNPAIIEELNEKYRHWNLLYNENIGNIQSFFYELYLKNNNIPTGRKNYGEVVNIIVNYNNN